MTTRLRFLGVVLVSLVLALGPLGLVGAQQLVGQQEAGANLDSLRGSGVTGSVIVSVNGENAPIAVSLSGLTAGATYSVNLQTGTCAMPSASFGRLGSVTADAAGNGQLAATNAMVSATGAEVPLTVGLVLDGDHIVVVTGQEPVACGSLPMLAATTGPSALPTSGGLPLGSLAAVLGGLGLASLLLGWRLRRQ